MRGDSFESVPVTCPRLGPKPLRLTQAKSNTNSLQCSRVTHTVTMGMRSRAETMRSKYTHVCVYKHACTNTHIDLCLFKNHINTYTLELQRHQYNIYKESKYNSLTVYFYVMYVQAKQLQRCPFYCLVTHE